MSTPCKAYWWHGHRNFGDDIAPLILAHLSDADVSYAPAAEAEVVVTGSVLHHLPSSWTGTVLGAGSLYPDSKFPEFADYRAVRGPLTAALVPKFCGNEVVLGDPGLIANELVPQQPRRYELGIVPHWSDKELAHRPAQAGQIIISVSDDPLLVVKQIASCKRVISSSLHGIIVADAYGIPRRTELTPRFAAEGGDHKFRDHCAAVGVPFRVGEFQSPVFSRVEDRQSELYDCFKDYGHYIRRQAWAAAPDTAFLS